MAGITILDPTAAVSRDTAALASHPRSLAGLRIGMLHNTKPGGEILLNTIRELLVRDYKPKSVTWRQKPLPTVPASFVHEMATQCDVVVAALAD